jgi:hypothetical protein
MRLTLTFKRAAILKSRKREDRRAIEIYDQLEYTKLKDEQTHRIRFRDNLIYVTIVSLGGIFSLAITKEPNVSLVVPWACLILGWTYLVNDEKISAIGRYLRENQSEKISEQIGPVSKYRICGWESAHRSDTHRFRRKVEQLVVDEITFFAPGVLALLFHWSTFPHAGLLAYLIYLVEFLLLFVLATEIGIYADWGVSKGIPDGKPSQQARS